MKKSATYQCWNAMIQRCTNPHNPGWKNYGARGITVSPRWLTFRGFLADMGEKPPKKYLERKDVNGTYCKLNCKWATAIEQSNNRRSNKHHTFNGLTLTQAQWARRCGLTNSALHSRLAKGWTLFQALTTPRRSRRPRVKIELRLTETEYAAVRSSFCRSGKRIFCDWLREQLLSKVLK